jgi:L-alanine-DL-glutamate epimerase-like enolase superfamily enzyme
MISINNTTLALNFRTIPNIFYSPSLSKNKNIFLNDSYKVPMKIKDINTFEVSIPVKEEEKSKVVNLVEVTTDEGYSGIGELRRAYDYSCLIDTKTPPPRHTISTTIVEKCLSPLLIGEDPFDIERLFNKMYRSTQSVGQRGLVIIAISSIENALWDIIGKAAGKPVYKLIGGQVHDRIKAYASLKGYPSIDDAVNGAVHYLEKGFKAIKFHQREVESSIKLRKEVEEDVEIMIDPFGWWTPSETIKEARKLKESNITWLECPVYPTDDIDGLAKVTSAVGDIVPICAGENEYTIWGFKHLINKRAVNILNPDPVKCGGLWQAKKIAALAEVEQVLCTPHSACSEVGLETSLHFAASTPNAGYAEVWGTLLSIIDGLTESILVNPIEIKKGYLKPSDKPGFGIEIDWDIIEKFAVK